MSIYKKPNSNSLHIDFRVDGVRYAFSSGTASMAKAKQIKSRAMEEARRRAPGARGRRDCTFDEAAYFYWDLHGQSNRDFEVTRGMVRRCVLMVGPDTMCSTIDLAKILGYRRDLRQGLKDVPALTTPRPLKDGKYSARNVNKYLSLVFTILRNAERVLKTKFPDRPDPSSIDDSGHRILEKLRPRSRYLRPEEELRLEAVSEPDLLDMWKADLELGLREANLCEARWREVDLIERSITVMLKAEGSAPMPHTVHMTDAAYEIFSRRRGIHPEFVFTLPSRSNHWHDGKLRRKGQHIPVTPKLFYDRMREAWTAADIENLIIHDLRRTAARRVWEQKDIYAAQVFLGHRDLQTTADYIGIGPAELARALARHGGGGTSRA